MAVLGAPGVGKSGKDDISNRRETCVIFSPIFLGGVGGKIVQHLRPYEHPVSALALSTTARARALCICKPTKSHARC